MHVDSFSFFIFKLLAAARAAPDLAPLAANFSLCDGTAQTQRPPRESFARRADHGPSPNTPPSFRRQTSRDLLDLHIDDMRADGKPPRRRKAATWLAQFAVATVNRLDNLSRVDRRIPDGVRQMLLIRNRGASVRRAEKAAPLRAYPARNAFPPPTRSGDCKVDVAHGENVDCGSSGRVSQPDNAAYLALDDLFASVKGRSGRISTHRGKRREPDRRSPRDDPETPGPVLRAADGPGIRPIAGCCRHATQLRRFPWHWPGSICDTG